jgi:hypothetical protein
MTQSLLFFWTEAQKQQLTNYNFSLQPDYNGDILFGLRNNLEASFCSYTEELWIYDISLHRRHFCSQVLLHG